MASLQEIIWYSSTWRFSLSLADNLPWFLSGGHFHAAAVTENNGNKTWALALHTCYPGSTWNHFTSGQVPFRSCGDRATSYSSSHIMRTHVILERCHDFPLRLLSSQAIFFTELFLQPFHISQVLWLLHKSFILLVFMFWYYKNPQKTN